MQMRVKGRRIPYAPRLPPTLIRLLRMNAHRIISLLAFAIPSKAGRAHGSQGPQGPKGPSGPLGQAALRAAWAPSGPKGPAYTQRKAIPYKIDICTLYPVPCTLYLLRWLKMKPGLDLQQMVQTTLKCRRKDHSGRVLGQLARKLKMSARARSAANGSN